MQEQLASPADDLLRQALAVAFEAVLSQEATGQDQAAILAVLRFQLGKILAEAPSTGRALDTVEFRVHLAALCNTEIARQEARVS